MMDVMIVGLILFGLLFLWRWGSRRISGSLPLPADYPERLRVAAALLGGTVVLERSTVGGHVCWSRAGFPYYYYEKAPGAERWSVLSVGIRDKLLPTLQLRPREGPAPQLPPLRTRPPGAPPTEFDARFEVRIPPNAPDSLGPSAEVRERILDLADQCFPAHPLLEVHENRIRLFLPTLLDTGPKRMRFLDKGALLLEGILREYVSPQVGAGVQVLDVMVIDGVQRETCRVCGEGIVEDRADRILCAQCGTPHHKDCWEYTGMCSVFACQSQRSRVPGAGAAPRDPRDQEDLLPRDPPVR